MKARKEQSIHFVIRFQGISKMLKKDFNYLVEDQTHHKHKQTEDIMLEILIDVMFGNIVFQNTIGLPTDTYCVLLLADLIFVCNRIYAFYVYDVIVYTIHHVLCQNV